MSIFTENNSINTCTLNVNGLLDRQCQFSLNYVLLQNKVDISFLQDTHVSNLKVIKELENYLIVFNVFGILVHLLVKVRLFLFRII
jgi:hypothetical protein